LQAPSIELTINTSKLLSSHFTISSNHYTQRFYNFASTSRAIATQQTIDSKASQLVWQLDRTTQTEVPVKILTPIFSITEPSLEQQIQ
jgi:hypothetical protein